MNFQLLLLLVCLTCFQSSSGLGNKLELETRLEFLEEKFLKENGELRAKLHKQQVELQQQKAEHDAKLHKQQIQLQQQTAEQDAKLHKQQIQLQQQKDKIAEQESKLIEIKDRRKRQDYEYGNEVAFSASVLANTAPLGTGQVVVFDHVITSVDSTNSPSTYSNSTGVFTAPLNGLYVFSSTLTGLQGVEGHYHIYKNEVPQTVMWIHGAKASEWDAESISVILILARGDTVTIRNREAGHALNGEYYGAHSIFSGFLLREHDGQSSIIG